MTGGDLLWFLPIAILTSLALGAAGRRRPGDILRASLHNLWTLVVVVGGVALVIRLLVVYFA